MKSRDSTDAAALLEGSELCIHNCRDNPFAINRQVYTQHKLDSDHASTEHKLSWRKKLSVKVNNYKQRQLTNEGLTRFVMNRLPCISIMTKYRWRQWIMADIIAGLIIGVMHIPQSMAYAMLAGLDPMYGLYVSFFPPIIYFLFGTSRHNSIGPIAVISLLSGKFLDRSLLEFPLHLNISNSNVTFGVTEGQLKASRAAGLTMCVGIVQVLMSVLQLGFLTRYLTDPLISGFTVGVAIHVVTSQVPSCFGISIQKQYGIFKLPKTYYHILKKITTTNIPTLLLTLLCVSILIVTKEFINPKVVDIIKAPIPIDIFVVIMGTLASTFLHLNNNYSVRIVGPITPGLPTPVLPDLSNMSFFIADIFITAIIAFSICVSLAKILAKRNGYTIVSNQECLAYGLMNIISSFFLCFTSAASLGRSAIQDSLGSKSQLSAIISSILLLFVMLFIGPLFYALPHCILSSIILVALKGMFLQFRELKELWIFSLWDFGIWVVTFLTTTLLNIEYGLLVGLCLSILIVMLRTQSPKSHILGQIVGTDIYKNMDAYDQCKELEGVKIFRYEGSLYYACSDHFRKSLYKKVQCNPRLITSKIGKILRKLKKLEKKIEVEGTKTDEDVESLLDKKSILQDELTTLRNHKTHHVIIDCSTWSFMDIVGVKTLHQVIEEYKNINVTVLLANTKTDINEMFARSRCHEALDNQIIYVSVHDAILNSISGYKNKVSQGSQNGN